MFSGKTLLIIIFLLAANHLMAQDDLIENSNSQTFKLDTSNTQINYSSLLQGILNDGDYNISESSTITLSMLS